MNTRIAHKILWRDRSAGSGFNWQRQRCSLFETALRMVHARPRDLASWEKAACILGTLYSRCVPESTRRAMHNDGDGVYMPGPRRPNSLFPRRTRDGFGNLKKEEDIPW